MSAESDQRQADLERAEREIQRYLGGDSPLSEKYRAQSRETTPPHLDSAVLAHAQEQLQSAFATHRSHALRRRHRRWAVPLATAATMLVGVNLVWQLREQAVPTIASTAPLQQEEAHAPAAPARNLARAEPQAMKEHGEAQVGRLQSKAKAESESEPRHRAPPEAADAGGAAPETADSSDAGAPAPMGQTMQAPATADVPSESTAKREPMEFDEARPAELADAAGEPAAKKEQAKVDELRAAEGAARLQRESRADGMMAQRERKAMAASGFASAMQRAPAPASVPEPNEADDGTEPSAQDVARTLLIWLRMDDFTAIREQLDADTVDEQMLLAAASAAKAMDRNLQPEISESADGLWRIDYRDQALRCTAMLQLTSAGWTLLRIDVE
ncbi:MAG: hypothetical protein M3O62_07475 [Pseudomonadota bacterium]|nr:hypothetical protein [Pseudomonadota bacterium]